jgi:alginate O-acetyltransferase complex protein AlgI
VIDFLNLFKLNLPSFALDLILPVGISFYTFQTLSYTIDVYRGTLPAEKHLGYYALFVSYFPQLVAGPIERPETLIPQLKEKHTLDSQNLLIGSRILLSGFFRKVVLADFCGVFVNNIYNNLATSHSLSVYLATALFLLEIYFDFSGYSEIALGAARMMGVKLSVNFDKPFSSQSYSEFFRRWHITLNTWFRDYLYIPLGGNRKGVARKVLNLWIVFLALRALAWGQLDLCPLGRLCRLLHFLGDPLTEAIPEVLCQP